MTDVRLVRLRSADLDVMARARRDWTTAQGFPDAFGPARAAELAERIDRSGEFDGTELLLGIQVDGRLVGEVQARQPGWDCRPVCSSSGSTCSTRRTAAEGVGRDRARRSC